MSSESAQSEAEGAIAPRVSIGVPVYNGGTTLRQALDSLVRQTYRNLEIVISDNASTDDTEQICREYQSRDARIRYLRQPTNLGAVRNFELVLEEARAPFFMWAACDDVRSPDFVEVNLAFLEASPEHVASCSPVRFEGGDFDPARMGDGALEGDRANRILSVFAHPIHANGRFYSLMRRRAIAGCPLLSSRFLGSDWGVVAHLASQGKLHRTTRGWTVLGRTGVSGGRDIYRMHRQCWLDFWIPFRTLSGFAWQLADDCGARHKLRLALSLVRLNLVGFYGQILAARRPR